MVVLENDPDKQSPPLCLVWFVDFDVLLYIIGCWHIYLMKLELPKWRLNPIVWCILATSVLWTTIQLSWMHCQQRNGHLLLQTRGRSSLLTRLHEKLIESLLHPW